MKEEWSLGAPNPSMALGSPSKGGKVRTTELFKDVYLIGPETAAIWREYMDGAVRPAERAAKKVTEALHARPAL